jgi:sec-independent protein translocase protein TatA
MSIGPLEIGVLLIVVLLVFGAKKVPEIGAGLGRGMHDFAKGIKGEGETAPEQVESRPAPRHGVDV